MCERLRIKAMTQMHQESGLTNVDDANGALQDSQCELNGSKAPAHPTDSRRQRHCQVTHHRGRRLDAALASDGSDNFLDLGKQARQACGHEVRQQTEGAVSLRAIPAGHTKALRSGPRVAAMARKTTAAAGVQWAHGQGRFAPFAGCDVASHA